MRVLMIDDDAELADTVAVGLRHQRMSVDVAYDGPSGLDRALENEYDVIVLDRDLPGVHGDDVCTALIAERRRCRIIMLTAAAAMDDVVDGLHLGADDYLPKPFDFPVLVARITALSRRAQTADPPGLRRGDPGLDPRPRRPLPGGRVLDRPPEELGVLGPFAGRVARPASHGGA